MADTQTKLQKYSAPALEKGLDILEFLSLSDVAPTLSQIAHGIGRSKNEIFRMMIVLEERGYIERRDGDLFNLTSKLAVLAGERTDNSKLAELAEPFMLRLAEETELSNHLWVPEDRETLVVINSASSSQNYGVTVQVGYRTPFYPTSPGACFLSELESETARMLQLRRLAPDASETARAEFAQRADICRSEGHVALSSLESSAISEISAPVRDGAGRLVVAALTIPHFANALTDNRREFVLDKLKAAVAQFQASIATTMPSPRRSWSAAIPS
ncbi:MAG: helix-turn-helix domain-containing protein [Silicimonas sp.]|nr:helix-turn-helix domain-containing protein [Silicimonas sp.]